MIETVYKALVGSGIVRPSEFWNLSVPEVHWLIDHHKEVAKSIPDGRFCSMSESEVEQIYREAYGEP